MAFLKALRNWKRWLVPALLLVLALFLRSENLTSPYLLDEHAFRQSDTAGFAMAYLQDTFIPWDPSCSRFPNSLAGAPFGRVEAEFPLYAWIAVLPLKVLGVDYPPAPYLRVVWLLYFLAGAVYLYQLVQRLGGTRSHANISLFCYATLPAAVFFTVSIQPEGPGLLAAFAFFYHLVGYLDQRKRRDEWLCVLWAVLLLWTKVSNAFLFFPAAYLILARDGFRETVLKPRYWFWLVGICVPVLAWYIHIRMHADWTFGIWIRKWSSLDQIADIRLWYKLGRRTAQQVLTWPGLLIAATGFVWFRQSLVVRFAAWWALGFLCFAVVSLPAQKVHNYYQLPLVVPAALVMPFPILALLRNRLAGRLTLLTAALLYFLSVKSALSSSNRRGLFRENRSFVAGIKLANKHVPEGVRFMALRGYPQYYYNSGRSGFMGPLKFGIKRLRSALTRTDTRLLLAVGPYKKRMEKRRKKSARLRREFKRLQSKGSAAIYRWEPRKKP